LRTGLRGGFVPGIYHAQQAMTSLGYFCSLFYLCFYFFMFKNRYMAVAQGGAKGWKNSMWKWDNNISAIAVIEVVCFFFVWLVIYLIYSYVLYFHFF
jgi:hypothetical protein